MEIIINQQTYPVIITRKAIKNMYLRFKNNYIYINAPLNITQKQIDLFIASNHQQLEKLANIHQKKIIKQNQFYYLGRVYQIKFNDSIKEVIIENDVIYTKSELMLNHWLKKQMIDIFTKRLEICYNKFNSDIPYPNLKHRHMTTRWGVCHITKKSITLNTELIKYDTNVIDYVIVHELSHFIYANHQSSFWNLVASIIPDYQLIKKKLKE